MMRSRRPAEEREGRAAILFAALAGGALCLAVVLFFGVGSESGPKEWPGSGPEKNGSGKDDPGATVPRDAGGRSGEEGGADAAGDCEGHDHGSEPDVPVAGPAEYDREKSMARLKEMLGRAGEGIDKISSLNSLVEFLARKLNQGVIEPKALVEILREEDHPEMLDALLGALSAHSPATEDPAVREAMIDVARSDPNPDRRRAALLFLGTAVDPSGGAAEALLAAAERDPLAEIQMSALTALAEHGRNNQELVARIQDGVLSIVRTAKADAVRAQALSSLDLYGAQPSVVETVAGLLSPTSSLELRYSAASALGGAGPQHQEAVVSGIETAYGVEQDQGVRAEMIQSLVRAGRTQALEALQRLREDDPDLRVHIDDYVAILETGEVDFQQIQALKSERERKRSSPSEVPH
ncbi:MAG: hypothetical protein HY720_25610 [Planctomycetes bacterium]|nr:hypothetical protein [Planctomycetota bacterium]